MDSYHTPYYAAGYLMKEVNPRVGMITHIEQSEDLMGEALAEIRSHWDGLFMWGYPDVAVVNVTKEAIWGRMAALSDEATITMPDMKVWFGKEELPDKIPAPKPKFPREEQQEQFLRDIEIDPKKYYPEDVDRPILNKWPKDGINLDVQQMMGKQSKKKKAA